MERAFESRFRWLSMTPLGSPVEPDVKKIAARSFPPPEGTGNGRDELLNVSLNVSDKVGICSPKGTERFVEDEITTVVASVDSMIRSRAFVSIRGGTGTTTASASSIPKKAAIYSKQLGSMTTTRAPGLKPGLACRAIEVSIAAIAKSL